MGGRYARRMSIAPWLLLIIVGVVVGIVFNYVLGVILVAAGIVLILLPTLRGFFAGRRGPRV